MRLVAASGRRRLIATALAVVVVLGILSLVLPYVGGGHGLSPLP
jgi:hypothetical protein